MIKKILITLSIEDKYLPPLHDWGKHFDWSKVEEVHFLHVVKKNITPLEFGLLETPDEGTFEEMVPSLERFMEKEAEKIIPDEYSPRVFFHLSRDFYPDEEAIDYLKQIQADLVVVVTSGKHSIFHRSFTNALIKASPCDVYVVRPENHSSSRVA